MIKFFKRKIEERKRADLLEKEILEEVSASKEDEDLVLLAKKLKEFKDEPPILLPEINFEFQISKKRVLPEISLLKPVLATAGMVLVFLSFIFLGSFSPKFSGLNKEAIAKEKKTIKEQVLFHKKSEEKLQVILKNL